ncbi:hypothetical protein TNCV_967681 [Trichonephila clavipes]|nr:hypothetical protein TNCV_967681 [Trichonephila clavipes]
MLSFKITLKVGNPNFVCVVRAELLTMCFVTYDAADTVAIVHIRSFLSKISSLLSGLESLRNKEGVVSYENLLTINETRYSSFQEASRERATGLSKSEEFVNKGLDDAASVINSPK